MRRRGRGRKGYSKQGPYFFRRSHGYSPGSGLRGVRGSHDKTTGKSPSSFGTNPIFPVLGVYNPLLYFTSHDTTGRVEDTRKLWGTGDPGVHR